MRSAGRSSRATTTSGGHQGETAAVALTTAPTPGAGSGPVGWTTDKGESGPYRATR